MRAIGYLLAALLLATSAASAQSWRDKARQYQARDGFNGVLLVAVGPQIRAVEAVGSADAENGVAMQPSTRFETGSVSKWIAAIVVLQLVDQGRLALDAPVSRYLPDYRADTGARLTLRRLLSHASGLPNQVAEARKDVAARGLEIDQAEAVRRYASGDLRFEPGTAWDYSHSNWVLVKAVVERVSGLPYAELVQRLLVAPLKLNDSGIFRGDSSRVAGMAVGYQALQPQAQRKPNPMPDFLAMAGGFYTSAPDLLKLMDAVLRGTLLTPASRTALLSVLMPQQHYALGGRVRTEKIAGREREAVWQDGSNGGFRMVARQVLEDGHTVIVLSNASFDHARLGAIATELLELSYAPEGKEGR